MYNASEEQVASCTDVILTSVWMTCDAILTHTTVHSAEATDRYWNKPSLYSPGPVMFSEPNTVIAELYLYYGPYTL